MRVISQDGTIDVPYEMVVIQKYTNAVYFLNCNLAGAEGVDIRLAKYSTEVKATKAMEMLEKHHRLDLATNLTSERVKKFFANARRTKSNVEIMADISKDLTKYEYFPVPTG
jgi:hypothetical protein